MSQPRVRKMLSNGAEMPRNRTKSTKASGDSMACPIRPHHDILPSSSKNKIPKSLRYDLENALVGLCDVWFEEIKPHLVRNNIKLHVSGSSAGGDHERLAPANPASAPPPSLRTPGCSHLDPGAAPDHLRRAASCVGSSSTPPTVSSAPCARLRTPSRRPLSPLLSVPQTPRDCPPIQSLNCEKKLERRCIPRKHRRFQPQPRPTWRVPRLCRTYTVLCRTGAGASSRTAMTASHRPPQPPRDDYYRFIVPRRESVMKNKTTQTEEALCVSRGGCQSRSPKRSPAPRCSKRSPAPCSPKRSPAPCSPKRSPAPCSPKRSPAPRSPTCDCDPISPTCNADSISPDCASPPLIVPPHIICRPRRPAATVAEIPGPLLQDDLIDIIAEGNGRRLRLLYSSSDKDNHPSFMYLVPNSQQEQRGLKKLPPWR